MNHNSEADDTSVQMSSPKRLVLDTEHKLYEPISLNLSYITCKNNAEVEGNK